MGILWAHTGAVGCIGLILWAPFPLDLQLHLYAPILATSSTSASSLASCLCSWNQWELQLTECAHLHLSSSAIDLHSFLTRQQLMSLPSLHVHLRPHVSYCVPLPAQGAVGRRHTVRQVWPALTILTTTYGNNITHVHTVDTIGSQVTVLWLNTWR